VLRLSVLILVGLGTGCATYSPARLAVYGPYSDRGAAIDQAQGAAISRGYTPEQVDREAGSFVVTSHYRPTGQPQQIRFQMYREGWLVLRPQGSLTRPSGDPGAVDLPITLANEYASLGVGLMPPSTGLSNQPAPATMPSSPAAPRGALNPDHVSTNVDWPLVGTGIGFTTVGLVLGVPVNIWGISTAGSSLSPLIWLTPIAGSLFIPGIIMIIAGATRTNDVLEPSHPPFGAAIVPVPGGAAASAHLRF